MQMNEQAVFKIERPHPNLMTYYVISSLILGPFFFIPLIPLFFRYETMRYRFDNEGISMRWGLLFRKEINLTYARIQDIHLTSNFIERWLGLAQIQIQTASGNAGAEMVVEGLAEYELIRDYLYSRMRGMKEIPSKQTAVTTPVSRHDSDSMLANMQAIVSELREIRLLIETNKKGDV